MIKGKLYLIPNIISAGTEEVVIAPMIKDVLSRLDYFLVENVRTARRYISSLSLGLVIENLQFEVLDKSTKDVDQLMQPLLRGVDAGVISESGCPGVADPGAKAVAYAHAHGVQVIPLAGPSSILMALMGSGFTGQSFVFHGYLPIDKADRIKKIKQMESDSQKLGQTQIFMDTPYRNEKLFDDLISTCRQETKLSIGRDITGEQELVFTESIKKWKGKKPELHKIPTIFVLFA